MSKDVFGKALLDYQLGKNPKDIIVHCSHTESEELPVSYLFRKENELPILEKKALELVKGKTLDVGAGAGAHSLILQSQGKEVVALEISRGACEVMKQQGIKKVVNTPFLEYSEEKFDTILLLMNGIGIAETVEQLPVYLNHLKSLLNPGGQIIFDSSDISYLYQNEDGSYWVDMNARYYGELSYQWEYNGEKGNEFPWLFIDENEIGEIASNLGLNFEKIMDGEHYDYLGKLTVI